MTNSEYWNTRFISLENAQYKNTSKYIGVLKQEYDKSLIKIRKDISDWYTRLADNNEITYAAAKELLDKRELKEFKWTIEEYIQKGKQNAINQKWIKEIENASAKVHIDKLKAIEMQIQNELEHLYNKYSKETTEFIKQQYIESYYKSAYELQKGLEKFENVRKLDTNKIEKIIFKPWTTDNRTFSDRIWNNKEELLNTLQKELVQATSRGDALDDVITNISQKFNTTKKKAGRLVMTEAAFFSSVGQKDCFNSLGIKQYEIVATLDNRTSVICQELDGKVFDMKDYRVGITAPPFHCNCRSVTAPYFDDEFTAEDKRIARDENGNTIYVDSKINYKEWYSKYVEGSDYVIKTHNNYKAVNERLSIKQAINTLPNKYKELLKNISFDIITEGNSGVKGNTVYILKGANKYEVIHELGHVLVDKLRLNNDTRYIDIINNTLDNFTVKDIILDPVTYTKEIFRIESNKFVTEYQSRAYPNEGFLLSNGKLNYKAFKDYFPEGLRVYYQDKELLKRKNIDLYNYIEEFINNGKKV